MEIAINHEVNFAVKDCVMYTIYAILKYPNTELIYSRKEEQLTSTQFKAA